MKKTIHFIKNNWQVVTIVIITTLVWYKLLGQTIFGEGYYYFDRGQDFINQTGKIADTRTADVFAKILFDILPPIFKDNITYYLGFQLLTMIILNLTFFYTLVSVTREKWFSFTATIFFSISYIGLFEMLGTGNYQRFVQRVPNLIFLLISFYFLAKYLKDKKIKSLILSYATFTLAVFLAHFSTFLLPLFMIYPIIFSLSQKEKVKSLTRNIVISLPYLLINNFLISQDPLEPTGSLMTFLKQKDLLEKVILQFASLNFPTFIIDKISTISQPFKNGLILITIPIILLYLFGFLLVRKRTPKLKVLYLTSLIVIPILLLINLYIGKVNPEFNISGFHYYFLPSHYIGKIDTFTSIKGDRYFLVPMFFVSIIWSSLFLALFKKKEKLYKSFIIIFFAGYTIYNISLIWDKFDKLKPLANEVKSYISYIKSIKSEFKPNTTLIVPEYFLWPSGMIRDFYGYPDMAFLSSKRDWQKEVNPKFKDEVIIIDYNYQTNTFRQLTKDYQNNKKLIFSNY